MPADISIKGRAPNVINPVIALLLGGILLALVVLIAVVALGGNRPGIQASQQQTAPAAAIGDSGRIKGALKKGKTYKVVLNAGLEARVEDKAYTVKTVTNMVYMAEFAISRKILDNDGQRIVEERSFDSCRTLKAESHVQDLKLEWGFSGDLLLAGLDYLEPGAGQAIQFAKPVLESLLKSGAQSYVDGQVQTWGQLDSLSGKTVRIIYEDGKGVVALERVRGDLSPSEDNFVRHTAVLSDCFILPDIDVKPGQEWSVDAAQLSSLVDPSLRGIPSGRVTVRREADEPATGKRYARLSIQEGTVQLDNSDNKTDRIGSFSPSGTLRFNLSDDFMEQADLTGHMRLERLSKDHLLFEARMRTQPKVQVRYRCTLQN
jgi:hypothetical protein